MATKTYNYATGTIVTQTATGLQTSQRGTDGEGETDKRNSERRWWNETNRPFQDTPV